MEIPDKEKEHITLFLTNTGYLPYTEWEMVTLTFGGERMTNRKILSEIQCQAERLITATTKGIYILVYQDGTVMYIGQGYITERIYKHYEAHFKRVVKPGKEDKYHDYFSSKTGEVVAYWIGTKERNKAYRIMIEYALIHVLEPDLLPDDFV
jgi:hypothetical protein